MAYGFFPKFLSFGILCPAKITFSSSLFSFKNRHRTYLFDRAYEHAECGLGRYVDVSYYCISDLHLISISFQFCTRAVIDRSCVNTLRSSISSSLFLILKANFFTLTTHFFENFLLISTYEYLFLDRVFLWAFIIKLQGTLNVFLCEALRGTLQVIVFYK